VTDRPTRLILIRHAEPDATVRGQCYGSLDVALSDAGRENANAAAAALAYVPITTVYTSPLLRARETATAIARQHQLPLVTVDDLRELDFGDCEGRSYDEIAETMPDLYARWMSAPTEVVFPRGESFLELRERVAVAAARIRDHDVGGTAVLVTHGGVCRAIAADVLNLAPALIFRLDIGYARTVVIDWFGGEPVVRLLNGHVAEVQSLDGPADDGKA
jgi:alpha-ribazole phosphatase